MSSNENLARSAEPEGRSRSQSIMSSAAVPPKHEPEPDSVLTSQIQNTDSNAITNPNANSLSESDTNNTSVVKTNTITGSGTSDLAVVGAHPTGGSQKEVVHTSNSSSSDPEPTSAVEGVSHLSGESKSNTNTVTPSNANKNVDDNALNIKTFGVIL
jgi:hypothetical protein